MLLFYIGLVISGTGVILYITHTILYNYYLRKNRPDLLEQLDSEPGNSSTGQKENKEPEVKIVITESGAPGWVMLLVLPAMPIFLVGIGVIVLSLVIKILGWIF